MPDQFGGPKNKKFMSKNLKILLTANSHKPMNQQKEILENTLLSWLEINDVQYEQTDDITVIGVRFC